MSRRASTGLSSCDTTAGSPATSSTSSLSSPCPVISSATWASATCSSAAGVSPATAERSTLDLPSASTIFLTSGAIVASPSGPAVISASKTSRLASGPGSVTLDGLLCWCKMTASISAWRVSTSSIDLSMTFSRGPKPLYRFDSPQVPGRSHQPPRPPTSSSPSAEVAGTYSASVIWSGRSASVRSPGRTRSVSMGAGSWSMGSRSTISASVRVVVVVVAVEAFLWRRWLVALGAVGLERCWRGVEVLSWRRKGVVRGAEAVHVDRQEAGPRNLCRPRISMSLTRALGVSWWQLKQPTIALLPSLSPTPKFWRSVRSTPLSLTRH